MRQITQMIVLVAIVACQVPIPCWSKSKNGSDKPNLRIFSPSQLRACLDDPKVCGTNDSDLISDELISRMPKLSSEQLIACFDDWKICGTADGRATGWPISDELASRGSLQELLARFWKEPKLSIRSGIEHVAYQFDKPEVTLFMRRILTERIEDGEDRYWPINYLAKKCDSAALKELSTGHYRNQGSLQYQTSVELFGKCKYRSSIPYLVDTAIYDLSFNIVGAAQDSLRALYPDSPKDFEELEEMQQYFCERAKREGFGVHCKSR